MTSKKEEALDDLPWKDERTIVNQMNSGCVKGNIGETSERQAGAYMGFSEHIDTILNWTEVARNLRIWMFNTHIIVLSGPAVRCYLVSVHSVLSSVLFSHLKAAVHGCSLIVTMFLNNKWNIKLADANVILMQESSWWWQCTLGTDFPFLHFLGSQSPPVPLQTQYGFT